MAKEIKKGDIRPVYQQIGWEVCKKAGDSEKECEFVATEKLAEAEVLSLLYKLEDKKE